MEELEKQSLIRLNKHLALVLGISRRQADDLIAGKKVKINDNLAILGARFNKGDKITVDNKLITEKTEFIYLTMNKPTGYVCSRRQQGKTPTIYELLPEKYHNLKTVGRLDRDSSGLILLTNDGDFTYQMTHPSFFKTKIYNVRLENNLQPLHQQMISGYGIKLDDGPSKLQLERMNDTDRKSWIVTMHEGRNRQIRRTFGSLGYTVAKLHRKQFGRYALNDLPSGQWQEIKL